MKKIRSLQILVYIVLVLFIIQNESADALAGFKDGWNDGSATENQTPHKGPALMTVLDGSFFTHTADSKLKVGGNYLLTDVSITSKVYVNNTLLKTPLWMSTLKIILVAGLALLLFIIGYTINKVIMHIYKGSMFDRSCIALIRRTGMLLLLFSLADYAYQRLDYAEQSLLIRAPLKVLNTAGFDFGILLTAIFIYIIAEAFKQGNRLKEEQELTI